ncbi:laccase-14-like [Curcuma longa]|uniref:laccase-14-like n=1 Tax=Curcuma longa TaxID=136217 RepID=UPI003D9ECF25
MASGDQIPLLAAALLCALLAADSAVVERTFHVGNLTVSPLCERRVITAVNGKLPGPTIRAREGDTLLVLVVNHSPYGITIHWHGVFQKQSGWADGPSMITQCPIRPGGSYAYRFNVSGQEGTLWWHAHASFLRATVHGALIIRPRNRSFPFRTPHRQVPILLGEWWNADVVDLEKQAFLTGGGIVNVSDAFTINGKPGELYPRCKNHTYKLEVVSGETYLLRIINSALHSQLFFKIAGHSFTVVAVDASYTKPYDTDVVVIAAGQTVDALMVANAPSSRYYMAARPYFSSAGGPPSFDNTTATAIVRYADADDDAPPWMPRMPALNDTPTAHRFYTNLTGLRRPGAPAVPLEVEEHMFVTVGLGVLACEPTQVVCNRSRGTLGASMNNVSFRFPTAMSLLEAHFRGFHAEYQSDFPDRPPAMFDFTNNSLNTDPRLAPLLRTQRGTKVKRLKYNATVEMVLQNTAFIGAENHPLHLHGFNFFVLAQGFGNYNATTARSGFNLVDPQVRNTIGVPAGGWAVIRFVADNPGVWIMHCHLEQHVPLGLATVFVVENGTTPDSVLPPPPPDFPAC